MLMATVRLPDVAGVAVNRKRASTSFASTNVAITGATRITGRLGSSSLIITMALLFSLSTPKLGPVVWDISAAMLVSDSSWSLFTMGTPTMA